MYNNPINIFQFCRAYMQMELTSEKVKVAADTEYLTEITFVRKVLKILLTLNAVFTL